MTWARACAAAEVAEGTALAAEVKTAAGKACPVAIVRTGGEFFAIRDVCSHAEVPLSEGEIDETTIECWLHGSRFDLRTGRPTGLPATKPVPVYETRLDGDDVLVRIEEK
jgi:3-phenylpropionate/trans-cinnamate dioxygenase ferredoxin component